MAGRFQGLSDLEWKLFEDIFPEEPSKRGSCMPHTPYRYVLNSLLYIMTMEQFQVTTPPLIGMQILLPFLVFLINYLTLIVPF